MSDRELLEMAAKAAGLFEHKWSDAWKCLGRWTHAKDGWYFEGPAWNPLTDDGDALRLACHLFMSVSTGPVEASANTIAGALRGQFFRESTIDELDTAAAVRRAIVRAAAEIGRSAS